MKAEVSEIGELKAFAGSAPLTCGFENDDGSACGRDAGYVAKFCGGFTYLCRECSGKSSLDPQNVGVEFVELAADDRFIASRTDETVLKVLDRSDPKGQRAVEFNANGEWLRITEPPPYGPDRASLVQGARAYGIKLGFIDGDAWAAIVAAGR